MGNILSKNPVHKIQLKSKGVSQFGGQSVWFDMDINRLNIDSRGLYLGDFMTNDHILVVCKNGEYYTTNFDLSNRYQGEILLVEKLDITKIYSAVYYDGEDACFYVKRFSFEPNDNTVQLFISESPGSYLLALSSDKYPQLEIIFAGKHQKRTPEKIDVEEFISCKSFRAKGKRLTTFETGSVTFIESIEKEGVAEEMEFIPDEPGSPDEEENNVASPTLF